MVVLGVDPGIATVGFGIVRAERGALQMIKYGAIRTPPNTPLAQRLQSIAIDLGTIITQFRPDALAVEELFFKSNITTAIPVAHGRGVILLTGAQHGLPVFEYTPMQVKMGVVGYGGAEKNQIMDMTRRLLKMDTIPRPDDAADALAIAICHAHTAASRLPARKSLHNPGMKAN